MILLRLAIPGLRFPLCLPTRDDYRGQFQFPLMNSTPRLPGILGERTMAAGGVPLARSGEERKKEKVSRRAQLRGILLPSPVPSAGGNRAEQLLDFWATSALASEFWLQCGWWLAAVAVGVCFQNMFRKCLIELGGTGQGPKYLLIS